ncbi:MAG: carboxypeptidase regulatory-like domain-containing protein [Acidobacteria bacterium]|nr:carboxypeptidase regulatory-like domain-containing protein [Acidobacteriota bacterium]
MRVRFTRILAILSLAATALFAQRDLGTITGTVTDPSGGVVAGAKIILTEKATGTRQETTTDSSGTYVRTLLRPGTYTVEVSAPGFKTGVQREVLLGSGDRIGVNMALTVGEVSQSVEISASAPLLQTETTTLGNTMQSKQVSELPLGGQRKFTFLAPLAPGVVPAEQGARDAAGGGFSANGVRSNGQNNFLLNGVDNNVNVIDFINQSAYVIGPSVEAIGEMRVVTNGYSAEYGRGAGGVVNITIKSGTNQLHGAVFEFLQNDKLNANTWERNRAGATRPYVRQNQYGAAIGGPVIKNRTFWFADWQGTRVRSLSGVVPGLGGITAPLTIPKAAFRNGDFSSLLSGATSGVDALGRAIPVGGIYDIASQRPAPNGNIVRDLFPGNMIPASRFDPAAKKLLDLFPSPNQNLLDRLPGANYLPTAPAKQDNDQFDVRIDHRLTDKDSLFGSLSWSEENKLIAPPLPGALDAAGFNGASEKNQGRNAMLSWTRVWSPTFLTETRAAFSRLITQRFQGNQGVDQFAAFGIRGLNPTGSTNDNGGLPQIDMGGYSSFGGSNWLPTKEYNNVWDFIENVSINKGKHALKFGYEYRPIKFPFFQVPASRGNFAFPTNRTSIPENSGQTGDGAAAFLLGLPGNSRLTTTNFISSEKSAHAWYFQDDWKLTSRLTMNIGIRYEIFSPISERFARQSNYVPETATLVIPKGPNQDAPLPSNFAQAFPSIKVDRGNASKYLIPWDLTDWAPRIGIAYQISQKFVLRGGYGLFYGGEENQGGSPNRGEGVPFNQIMDLNLDSNFQDKHPFLNRFSDGWPLNTFNLPANISFRGVSTNFRNPLVSKWNFTVQRDLGWGSALELSYIGSNGTRQLINWDPNTARNSPVPNADVNSRRLYPYLRGGLSLTSTFGISNYNALAAKFEKRMSHGLTMVSSYTWGHTFANTGTTLSGSSGVGVYDINCGFRCEYGAAAWDIRHRSVTSFNFDLPFGKGKKFGAGSSKVADAVIGGWQTNGIFTLSSGQPFTFRSQNCVGSFNSCRPDAVSGKDPMQAPASGRTPDQWFDVTALQTPAPGTGGNLGPQTGVGPGIVALDFSAFKTFQVNERFRVQFRSEWLNMGNTPRFAVSSIGNTQGSGNFGRLSATLPGTARNVQFALKLLF